MTRRSSNSLFQFRKPCMRNCRQNSPTPFPQYNSFNRHAQQRCFIAHNSFVCQTMKINHSQGMSQFGFTETQAALRLNKIIVRKQLIWYFDFIIYRVFILFSCPTYQLMMYILYTVTKQVYWVSAHNGSRIPFQEKWKPPNKTLIRAERFSSCTSLTKRLALSSRRCNEWILLVLFRLILKWFIFALPPGQPLSPKDACGMRSACSNFKFWLSVWGLIPSTFIVNFFLFSWTSLEHSLYGRKLPISVPVRLQFRIRWASNCCAMRYYLNEFFIKSSYSCLAYLYYWTFNLHFIVN